MEYRQYFTNSFQDTELQYITFSTQHFHISVYFSHNPCANQALIYSKAELSSKSFAGPMFTLSADKIDIYHLPELDRKLQTLALFT
jgi:hypothetical protein